MRIVKRHKAVTGVAAGVMVALVAITLSTIRMAKQSRRTAQLMLSVVQDDDSELTFKIDEPSRRASTGRERAESIKKHIDKYRDIFEAYADTPGIARYHRRALSALGEAQLGSVSRMICSAHVRLRFCEGCGMICVGKEADDGQAIRVDRRGVDADRAADAKADAWRKVERPSHGAQRGVLGSQQRRAMA